jgi:hypothetical protein
MDGSSESHEISHTTIEEYLEQLNYFKLLMKYTITVN